MKNNKTWKQLMSKQEFIDWCFTNEDTNIIHIVSITTEYEYPLIIYGDNGGIINLLEYIQGTLKNRNGYKLIIRLLGTIYDLYSDSIPYCQTLTQINLVSANNQAYLGSVITPLCKAISAYINLYIQDILQWYFVSNKFMSASAILSSGNTRKETRDNNIDNTSQNQQLTKTSFNPVNKNPTISINPIKVNTQENGGIGNNSYTDNTSATWGTTTQGTSGNTTINETISEQDLTQLRDLGSENMLKYLKPLIYKIGTLFWILGDDLEGPNTWGVNVW